MVTFVNSRTQLSKAYVMVLCAGMDNKKSSSGRDRRCYLGCMTEVLGNPVRTEAIHTVSNSVSGFCRNIEYVRELIVSIVLPTGHGAEQNTV